MDYRKVFMTFGGGGALYHHAAYRLGAQITDSGLFNEVHAYTDIDLKEHPDFADFWPQHGAFVERSPRGYGYWLWKPYLIKRLLARMADGDVLVYADAGCEMNADSRQLQALIEHAASHGLCVADVRSPCTRRTSQEYVFFNGELIVDAGHDGLSFSKADLLHKFPQVQAKFGDQMCGATVLALCKSKESVGFVDTWYELACADNYHYLDDSPSMAPNHPSFREHRHDQAIFSLLIYANWPQLELSKLPYLAFTHLRNRSGKNSNALNALIAPATTTELPLSLVKTVRTSSSALLASGHLDPFQSVSTPIIHFLFAPTAPSFTFHTENELTPYWECLFVKPLFLDRLVIFNRPGYEARAVPLRVQAYDTRGELVSIMRVDMPFGGAHDKSPLLVELGSRVGPFTGLRLQVDQGKPSYLHLARIMICVPPWQLK